ncbi:uncharacterized protein LOC143282959 isoform X3 [Babylonia areolata]|uniref:uncharacterized protein LOC143282959 isoform X3 n=1 Tax=Babylonia areolata TaxID=304850 RepID=UPI003FD1D146
MRGRRILSVKWWVLLAMSLLAWYFPRALSEGRSNMRNGCQKDTERQEREPPKPVDAVAIFPWELQGPCYTKCTAVPKVQEGDKILIESHCLLSENSTAKIEYRVEDDDETLKSWASFRTQRFTQDRQSKRVSKIYLRFSIRDSAEVSRMWLKVNGTSMTVTCEKDETGMGDATEISASPLDRTTGAHPQPSTDNMLPYIIPSVLCVAAIIILLVVFIAKKREINRQGDEADQLLSCVSSASTDLGHAPPGETVHASASASGHVTGSGSEEDRRYGTLDHHHRGTRQTRGGRWGNKEEDDYHHVRLLPPPPPPSEKDEGEDGYDRFQRRTGRQVVVDNPYHHPLEN